MIQLKKLRGKIAEKGMSIERLAKEMGIDRTTLYRKMKSNREGFSIKDVDRIVEVLGLTKEETVLIFLSQFAKQKGRKMETEEIVNALQKGIPVHFYGPGLGKTTLCTRLREMGFSNVSEAGDADICGMGGCYSIPEQYSGMLVYFEATPAGENPPGLFELLNT